MEDFLNCTIAEGLEVHSEPVSPVSVSGSGDRHDSPTLNCSRRMSDPGIQFHMSSPHSTSSSSRTFTEKAARINLGKFTKKGASDRKTSIVRMSRLSQSSTTSSRTRWDSVWDVSDHRTSHHFPSSEIRVSRIGKLRTEAEVYI